MDDSKRFRDKAARMLELAQATADPERKAQYATLAQSWLNAARSAETGELVESSTSRDGNAEE